MAKLIWQGIVLIGTPTYPGDTATTVQVYDVSTGSPVTAQLWSDRAGSVTKANPFTISEAGVIKFYANAGRYRIVVTNGSYSRTLEDVVIVDPDAAGGGTVDTIVAGDGIAVDSTDTATPVVSSELLTANTATSYTLAASNKWQWMDLTGSSAINITCPPESSADLGDDFVHVISNFSTGTVTIVAGSGVTVVAPPGGTLIVPQNATLGIKKASHTTDTYIVFGVTEAV